MNLPRPCRIALAALAHALLLTPSGPAQAFEPPAFLTAWGAPGAGAGQFNIPAGIKVSRDGVVYVVESEGARVQKFSREGLPLGGWGARGSGQPGLFIGPTSIAVDDSGFVYVADCGNWLIQKFTSSGAFVKWWTVVSPNDIAVGPSGRVYVVDSRAFVVRVYTSSGVPLYTLIPPGSYATCGVAVDRAENVFIVDSSERRVWKFSSSGALVANWVLPPGHPGWFQYVRVACGPNGEVYAVYNELSLIQVFSNTGTLLGSWGGIGSAPGKFLNPIGVAVDDLSNVFVADANNNRIQRFAASTTQSTITSWGRLKALYR